MNYSGTIILQEEMNKLNIYFTPHRIRSQALKAQNVTICLFLYHPTSFIPLLHIVIREKTVFTLSVGLTSESET